jgi:class 3 adenylate cyclase/tetratricopeptide (TPR) repeat protein
MDQRKQVEQAIAALERERTVLGDAVVETALLPLQEKLAALQSRSGAPQRKQITVLFGDVAGFTSLSEKMDPEQVSDIMNALWRRLDAVITDWGGLIDKHMGDAVMALFGAPSACEDDPERAIRAALAMQETLSTFQRERSIPLAMRIGINTGSVLLGEVGTTAEYTAMGDAVNLASRLEDAAPVGGILICHDTYRHVRGVFDVRPLEPLQVKGKTERVQVYLVQGAKPHSFRVRSRGVEGLETRMVGRESELVQLEQALHALVDATPDEPQVFTIAGEAGVGKSRLLYEFGNWLDLLPETVWLFQGRADPRRIQLPYALIRDLFAFRFEIQDSDRASVAREKLEQDITEYLGPDSVPKAHFIGHLIGFDYSSSPYLRSILDDVRQIRDRAFYHIAQFFAAVAADHPAVLFLEDIHWADDGSLDLIDYLARECHHARLLILCLARPRLFERRPEWGKTWPDHTRLELHPLSHQDSHRLVAEILRKVPQIPPDLQHLVVSTAEGNPFYVEELVKMLIEDEIIVPGAEQWQVSSIRAAQVVVPPTLIGVLQARLDRLSPPERETLQRSSVIGRVFWDEAVNCLYVNDHDGQIGQTQEILDTLCRKELIFPRDTTAFEKIQEYTFKHTILHEVTYETVLKRLRRIYHAQVAEWLIQRSRERAPEYAGLIGEHYERAGEMAQAAEWYVQAGRQAQIADAPRAAVEFYNRALAFLPPFQETTSAAQAVQHIAAYEGLGNVLRWQAQFAEAVEAFRAMLVTAQAAKDVAAQARAWNGLSTVQDLQEDYVSALKSAACAEESARSAGVPAQEELARALFRKGWALYRLGDTERALVLAGQALDFAIKQDLTHEIGQDLNLLGSIHITLERYEEAARYLKRALEAFRRSGDRRMVAGTLNNLAVGASMRGDYRAAIPHYQQALSIAREIGNREGEMVFLFNLGGARVREGEHRAAEVDLSEALDIAKAGGSSLVEVYSFLAEAYLGQGKTQEALSAAHQALVSAPEAAGQTALGEAWRVLGMVAAKLPEGVSIAEISHDARSCFSESLRILAKAGLEAEQARTLREWARFERQCGCMKRGDEMWQQARAIFARLGLAPEVERMKGEKR